MIWMSAREERRTLGLASSRYLILAVVFILILSSVVPACYPADQANAVVPAVSFIDRERFLTSVPKTMLVGKTYTIVVTVTNRAPAELDFIAQLDWPFRTSLKYFFVPGLSWQKSQRLAPGETRNIQFVIVPLVEHVGELDIVARLYVSAEDSMILVDTVSTTVYELKLPVSQEVSTWMFVLCAFLLAVTLAVLFCKKPMIRGDLLISVLLFSSAILLRAQDPLKVAIHPDEITIWHISANLLYNNWTWTTDMMLNSYPPLFWYLEAAMICLAGTSFEAFRLLSIVSSSVTVVVVYMLGKSIFNRLTGLLSATLFSFSSYVVLISRISLTDSFVLLMTLASAYLLWQGMQSKQIRYMALSGLLVGLAFDTKYIAVCTVLSSLFYIVWVDRDLKSMLRRHTLAWLIAFILVILPVQILLLINEANPYLLYLEYRAFPQGNEPPQAAADIPARGVMLFIYILTRSANPWLPWVDVLKFVSVVLLPLPVIYHVYPGLKRRAGESFLVISFLVALLPLAARSMHSYWTIYSLPYLFIMISNLAVQAWRGFSCPKFKKGLPKSGRYLGTLRALILVLIIVFSSSQLIVGVVSPAVDGGEFDSFRRAMIFVKDRVQAGDIIADLEGQRALYYINAYNLNITEIPFALRPTGAESEEVPIIAIPREFNAAILELERLRFILLNRLQLEMAFSKADRERLFEKYAIAFISEPQIGYNWYPEQTWLVLERIS